WDESNEPQQSFIRKNEHDHTMASSAEKRTGMILLSKHPRDYS
ncbi:MAG: hypothetical protein ACJASG_001878, partial [Oleiphilaceae bacterium]